MKTPTHYAVMTVKDLRALLARERSVRCVRRGRLASSATIIIRFKETELVSATTGQRQLSYVPPQSISNNVVP